jgi:hypothetical protein
MLLRPSSAKGLIKALRKTWPGKWTYDASLHNWCHESGWYVYAESQFSPRFDGDDDSFVTRYRRSDTGQLLLFDFNGIVLV